MSHIKCAINDSAEKYGGVLNIKEELYDLEYDYDRANHCAQNVPFELGQQLETALKQSPLHDVFHPKDDTQLTGLYTTKGNSEQGVLSREGFSSNSFSMPRNVKSEPDLSDTHLTGTWTSEEDCEQSVSSKEGFDRNPFSMLPNVKSEPDLSDTHLTGTTEQDCEQSVLSREGFDGSSFSALPTVKSETDLSDKRNIGTRATEENSEQCVSSKEGFHSDSFSAPPNVKSEPDSEPESYESVCIKEEPNDPGYDAADHNNADIPSFGAENQDGEQGPLRIWTVTSSQLVPLSKTKGHHATRTSSVHENVAVGAQSLPRDKDKQDVNQSAMEAQSGTSHDDLQVSLGGQVKRGHQESVVEINKRQKRGIVTSPASTVVRQEGEDEDMIDTEAVSNKKTAMTCSFCSSTFTSKILYETHQCRDAIYYCKICYLESTRPRPYTLTPLPKAERHFYLHFHPAYFGTTDPTMTDCLTFKCQLPEELQGKTSLLKYEEVDSLKDLYIGIFQSRGDNPYNCGLCGDSFTTVGARVWHISKAHLEHKNRKCGATECENSFYATSQQDKLLRHMFAAHCDFVKGQSVHLKCKFCTMQFRDRTDLEWHFYWHMKPDMKFGMAAQKYSLGQPMEDLTSEDARTFHFRCTICTFESVDSVKVQLYTAADSRDHLAWHWKNQLPPEIRNNPTIFNFEADFDAIYNLYMTPHAPDAMVKCKFCGKKVTGEGMCRHLESWHKDHIRKPHRCTRPECKHLQFIRKQDFFGHMFLQHVGVIKTETTFVFSCQICGKTFPNRRQVEWHCYAHRVRLTISARRWKTKCN
ncbi:uncharacterized protein LOC118418299 [Branchiostoma floridae]|uniref:Uncharacterized protein LOC118418299 n=1 Tax=Branchiostoma floridae TaxID=7739 RepID=A0A9J7LBZ4_BRAFL|nr:uncharacterized protein LOC118418299 [Branchiostoma floridae]XP_035680049.1 uncharacterized protein LOC118418299 [Branchiostoma floridae]